MMKIRIQNKNGNKNFSEKGTTDYHEKYLKYGTVVVFRRFIKSKEIRQKFDNLCKKQEFFDAIIKNNLLNILNGQK